jgi:hypothetical protein
MCGWANCKVRRARHGITLNSSVARVQSPWIGELQDTFPFALSVKGEGYRSGEGGARRGRAG